MAFGSNDAWTRPSAQVGGAESYDDGLRRYMVGVYNKMAGAVALTGGVAFAVANVPALTQIAVFSPLKWVFMLAPLLLVFFLSARIDRMESSTASALFWTYAGLMGASLATVFLAYTGASIARTFFISAGAFAALSIYGNTTKRDLTGFGSFLIMGLVGILIAGLVNIFLQSAAVHFVISAVGVLVFAGLTAYDTQKIKEGYYGFGGTKGTIMGALTLYLDFVNLFLFMLRFLGDRR